MGEETTTSLALDLISGYNSALSCLEFTEAPVESFLSRYMHDYGVQTGFRLGNEKNIAHKVDSIAEMHPPYVVKPYKEGVKHGYELAQRQK